jgi:hypothetical protein
MKMDEIIGEWKKQHIDEHKLCSFPNVIKLLKSKR